MLAVRGEGDAVDLGLGPRAVERDVLMDVGQPRAQAADRPLQAGATIDVAGLVSEVVGPRAPVLQLHVTELRVRTNQQLDRADVQAG